jgi:hypothetical protein
VAHLQDADALRASIKRQNLWLTRVFCHKRDVDIAFAEEPHLYYLRGKLHPKWKSVTGLIHLAFHEFDKHKAYGMLGPSNPMYGKSKEEVFATWDAWRDLGTVMHRNIELWQNCTRLLLMMRDTAGTAGTSAAGSAPDKSVVRYLASLHETVDDAKGLVCPRTFEILDSSREFQMFLDYERVWVRGEAPLEEHRCGTGAPRPAFLKPGQQLRAFRTEMVLWFEPLLLSGTIDMLYWVIHDGKFKLVMVDWKRARKLSKSARTTGIGHLFDQQPDTNYWHYCLQLNIYTWILENVYGFEVMAMYLAIFHPDQETFNIEFVPKMTAHVEEVFRRRSAAISGG